MNQEATVKLQYGTYSGEIKVLCDENEDTEYIIARAFKKAECNFLPMAYKSGKIIKREYI
jgi:hypothetical protein